MGSSSGMLDIYIYHRGAFGVARFDRQGNAKALTREASDRELAPRFFVYVRFVFNRLISSLWRPSDILRCICTEC